MLYWVTLRIEGMALVSANRVEFGLILLHRPWEIAQGHKQTYVYLPRCRGPSEGTLLYIGSYLVSWRFWWIRLDLRIVSINFSFLS